MGKLKIAIIGVGNIAENHIASYKNNENVELYAFCDINADTLAEKGKKHGITRLYTDEQKMFDENPEIDAVSDCTWNNGHAPATIIPGTNAYCVYLGVLVKHLLLVGIKPCNSVLFSLFGKNFCVDIAECIELDVLVVLIRCNMMLGNVTYADYCDFKLSHF